MDDLKIAVGCAFVFALFGGVFIGLMWLFKEVVL